VKYHQNPGQSHYIKRANESLGNIANLKHSGIRVTTKITFTKKLRKIKIGECLIPLGSKSFVFLSLSRSVKILKMYKMLTLSDDSLKVCVTVIGLLYEYCVRHVYQIMGNLQRNTG
jgi:hypothetical protein